MSSLPLTALARTLAALQAAVWLVVLMHGGWGLIFAPMGALTALVGGRHPAVGAALVAAPTVWLTASWAGILGQAPTLGNWGVWAGLTLPAFVAAAIFVAMVVKRQVREGSSSVEETSASR
jgi:Na+-driven multidrug efflux pump